ncbi:hypothetical protein KY314_00405 [Candidatus Woesearchaeota archaeon]|nr:hypothetical protein [Candidatus Woesearchaeota archaeon]
MKTNKFILLIILIIIIFSGISMIFFSEYKIKGSISLPMKIQVAEKLGFTLETEILDFGKAMPGNIATRPAVITNPNNVAVYAHFCSHGDMENWVKKQSIYLNKHESKNITISAKIPKNVEFGEYTGVLRIVFKRA